MKFRVDRDALAESVAWAARSLPTRPSVPVLAGLLHVVIFTMESALFRRPQVHGRFRVKPQDLAAVRPWC